MADIIVDADREMVLGMLLGKIVKNPLDHGGGEFFGGQAIASPDEVYPLEKGLSMEGLIDGSNAV
jgi:hypothetical protein